MGMTLKKPKFLIQKEIFDRIGYMADSSTVQKNSQLSQGFPSKCFQKTRKEVEKAILNPGKLGDEGLPAQSTYPVHFCPKQPATGSCGTCSAR
jgi:hypothetical protein